MFCPIFYGHYCIICFRFAQRNSKIYEFTLCSEVPADPWHSGRERWGATLTGHCTPHVVSVRQIPKPFSRKVMIFFKIVGQTGLFYNNLKWKLDNTSELVWGVRALNTPSELWARAYPGSPPNGWLLTGLWSPKWYSCTQWAQDHSTQRHLANILQDFCKSGIRLGSSMKQFVNFSFQTKWIVQPTGK